MNVSFSIPPQCILREHVSGERHFSHPGGEWLSGAFVNPASNCLSLNCKRNLNDTMVLWRDEGKDDLPVNKLTLKELREEVWYATYHISFVLINSFMSFFYRLLNPLIDIICFLLNPLIDIIYYSFILGINNMYWIKEFKLKR